ncbi:DNA-processing protein DprA [Nonomuraea sp. NPDC049158]|uniref:DNA-processing protein DprA n=1 Tax=Nonomuraea sp. NPDC049158 TaxID=3155649 RepID=UPI0033C8CDEB
MTDSEHHRLVMALTAFRVVRTPGKIATILQEGGIGALAELFEGLSTGEKSSLCQEASELHDKAIRVVMAGDSDFPATLIRNRRPLAPVIFYWGERSLLHAPSIGMCGARSVTPLGIRAAHACGEEVSIRNMAVVSGYAKGVDTVTHLAALGIGGKTVIVLAEGFNHFRIKQDFRGKFDPDRVLVISQFPPSQPWGAYAAMTRNSLIYGLSQALVVVEAGSKGGTLAAGKGALKIGRPVFVLNFGEETPEGNRILISSGGFPIRSREELGRAIAEHALKNGTSESVSLIGDPQQEALPFE